MRRTICRTRCFESEPWTALFSPPCHFPSARSSRGRIPPVNKCNQYTPLPPSHSTIPIHQPPPRCLLSFLPSSLPSRPQSLRTGDGCSRRALGYCSYLLNTIIGGQAANHSASVARTPCFFFSFLSLYLECKRETGKHGGKIAQSVIANRGERGAGVRKSALRSGLSR